MSSNLRQVRRKVRYITRLDKVEQLSEPERTKLAAVEQKFVFRVTDYYLNLIDWDDPKDPIRQLIIPRTEELADWGKIDASDEAANTPVRGLQHKYGDTALLLCNEVCGAYCRYCFRKRLFMRHNDETAQDFGPAAAYVAQHPEITDVLLSGGDPLVLSTDRLAAILRRFMRIPHVRTIRIGSKVPAFNPYRLLQDEALLNLIAQVTGSGTAVYLMAHFDHPRELTDLACDGIQAMQQAGADVVNQCPIVRGVNDDAELLAELFEMTTELGMPQYYVFQGRPVVGNEPYMVPLVRGWQLFDDARRRCSGLSRRVRFAMSHASGKIEVLGLDDRHMYLRYHRARKVADESRIMVARRDDRANWFDDLELLEPPVPTI
ncbi:MAG: KamA family radical SAM protein [Gammaproteobacteria bacterium]|nr:KamA family radical SAM protein [Gammaproteobacteria bacterium]